MVLRAAARRDQGGNSIALNLFGATFSGLLWALFESAYWNATQVKEFIHMGLANVISGPF